MTNPFGANSRTSLTAIGGTIMAVTTWLATVSYDTSPLALVVPPKYKPTVAYIAGLATVILWVWNGLSQKDKNVTGGNVVQDDNGNVNLAATHFAETRRERPRK